MAASNVRPGVNVPMCSLYSTDPGSGWSCHALLVYERGAIVAARRPEHPLWLPCERGSGIGVRIVEQVGVVGAGRSGSGGCDQPWPSRVISTIWR